MTEKELKKYSKAELIAMLAEKEVDGLTSPRAVFEKVRMFANKDREHFIILILNGSNTIIDEPYVVSIGTANNTQAHPREVFREAIKKGAISIILCHNHPSGNVEPSDDDFKMTERLKRAGDIIGIKVLDHLVIGGNCYYSMREHGTF